MERKIDVESFMSDTTPSLGEGSRRDQTKFLGRELSSRENQFYTILSDHTSEKPISAERLYRQVYNYEIPNKKSACAAIWILVKRVRAKLGDEAIITRNRLGYLSRRSIIRLSKDTK